MKTKLRTIMMALIAFALICTAAAADSALQHNSSLRMSIQRDLISRFGKGKIQISRPKFHLDAESNTLAKVNFRIESGMVGSYSALTDGVRFRPFELSCTETAEAGTDSESGIDEFVLTNSLLSAKNAVVKTVGGLQNRNGCRVVLDMGKGELIPPL